MYASGFIRSIFSFDGASKKTLRFQSLGAAAAAAAEESLHFTHVVGSCVILEASPPLRRDLRRPVMASLFTYCDAGKGFLYTEDGRQLQGLSLVWLARRGTHHPPNHPPTYARLTRFTDLLSCRLPCTVLVDLPTFATESILLLSLILTLILIFEKYIYRGCFVIFLRGI